MSDNRYLDAILELCEAMKKAGFFLTDEQALEVQIIYPIWTSTGTYAVGDRVRYNGVLYRCLIAHTAQESWTPEAAASLWAKVLTDPSGEILPWVQPDSTNPYAKGDKVTHNGKTWESLVDNNVWEPGVYGWKEIDS